VTLETAIVLPVYLLVLLGLIVGGLGVFHYQQAACLAQEAARWASVRGRDYQADTNQPSPTTQQILQQVVPLAASMDTSQISLAVLWINQGTSTTQSWDSAPKDVKSQNAQGDYVSNTVRATITYTWDPGLLFSPVTLSCTSEVPMAN
jgi:Flp pilus assembly protein TadG